MNLLRDYRESSSLSMRQLAEKIGVSAATISDWELERSKPRPKNLYALAEALQCSVIDIFPDPETAAFANELITEKLKFYSEYKFRIDNISPIITVKLYKSLDSEQFIFEQSHLIHTPEQKGPYQMSRNFGDSEREALSHAVFSIVDFYQAAIRAGHEPDVEWFKENKDF